MLFTLFLTQLTHCVTRHTLYSQRSTLTSARVISLLKKTIVHGRNYQGKYLVCLDQKYNIIHIITNTDELSF